MVWSTTVPNGDAHERSAPVGERKIRILFVGEIHGSHARSWIRLLDRHSFDARCFQTTMMELPYGGRFEYPTYIPFSTGEDDDPAKIRLGSGARLLARVLRSIEPSLEQGYAHRLLARIIRSWRPDIIHTFGLIVGTAFLAQATARLGAGEIGRWIIQLRGGSDLALDHADPAFRPEIVRLTAKAEAVVTDNSLNFRYLEELGVSVPEDRRLIVPGTGGVDVNQLVSRWKRRPRERRLILWPKAYECPWSKALPVLEALRSVWDRLGVCQVQVLATDREIPKWLNLLPRGMADAFILHQRIPHEQVLEMMLEARVMLAPSLIDGTPNTMWEAMACGAVPIVSPLATITPLVEADRNVLFARNLYPGEIGAQLVRAMSDDELVERIAAENLPLVGRLAGRAVVGPKVVAFYRSLL